VTISLAVIEAVIDASGVLAAIENLLPPASAAGQLSARAPLLALADRRPAYLTEVRAALTFRPEARQIRLGVAAAWETGPHQLIYCRDAAAWVIPLRNVGAQLVQDLHPHDRGPKGTHQGAVIVGGHDGWRVMYVPCHSVAIDGSGASLGTPDYGTLQARRHRSCR